MDNKYGLGSRRLATEHHQQTHKPQAAHHPHTCWNCLSGQLRLCPTMQDHQCLACGEWQQDMPAGYAMGRPTDY